MIFQSKTEDGLTFTIESERWYEARQVARRFGAEDAEELLAWDGGDVDLLLEWKGSDANRSGDRHMIVHGEKKLRAKLEAKRCLPKARTNGAAR
jgi:hypothetical protein